MVYVVFKDGQTAGINASQYSFVDGILIIQEKDGTVVAAIPKENIILVDHGVVSNPGKDCKRESFSGGGSPSPRECDTCGEGPCPKSPEPPTRPPNDDLHVGDSVCVTECWEEPSWQGARRTVMAKLGSNSYVVGKIGEPYSRVYYRSELRLVPKPEGD